MHTGKFIVASMLIASFAAPALAAPWTPPAGSSGTISYSSGQDLNGFYKTPQTAEEKFVFSPVNFLAVSPGAPTSVTDTVSFTVTAPPGQPLDKVSVRIEGDYSFLGDPAQLDYSAVLDINGGTYLAPVVFVPLSPLTSGDGAFVGTAMIDLSPDVSIASVALTSSLMASSSGAGTTTMQIKYVEIAFTTIPEPASLGLIGGVASLLLRRRR